VPVRTYAHFDSDQAVFGLMARDLAAGRSFPMFMYGQRYLLAVSVWLCAPLFAVLGASIATLKLPMFLMNIAVVAMLWRGLRREPGLGPWGTTLAILPFAIPSAVISTRLVEHQGGNIEPFVFVLAAFFLRQRPITLGVLLGVAFLNREFSLIAFIALLLMDAAQGTLVHKIRAHLTTAMSVAGVVIALRVLAHWSTSYGGSGPLWLRPGWTKLADFFTQQVPTLIGGGSRRLSDFNIVKLAHRWPRRRLRRRHRLVDRADRDVLALAAAGAPGSQRHVSLPGSGGRGPGGGVRGAESVSGRPYGGALSAFEPAGSVRARGIRLAPARTARRDGRRDSVDGCAQSAGNVRLVRSMQMVRRRDLISSLMRWSSVGGSLRRNDYWTAFDVAWVTGELVMRRRSAVPAIGLCATTIFSCARARSLHTGGPGASGRGDRALVFVSAAEMTAPTEQRPTFKEARKSLRRSIRGEPTAAA
jgi:hypothetical protein